MSDQSTDKVYLIYIICTIVTICYKFGVAYWFRHSIISVFSCVYHKIKIPLAKGEDTESPVRTSGVINCSANGNGW